MGVAVFNHFHYFAFLGISHVKSFEMSYVAGLEDIAIV